jgi:hypothetical protein
MSILDKFPNADKEKAVEAYPKVLDALDKWNAKGQPHSGVEETALNRASIEFLEAMGLMEGMRTRFDIRFLATTVAGVIREVEGN